MYCQKCGQQIDDEAIICPGCGVPTINYGQYHANGKGSRRTRPLVEESKKYQVVNSPKLHEKQKRNGQQGIWKLIVGGIFIINGLASFGENTAKMVFHILIGAGFVFWWLLSDLKTKEE